MFNHNRQGYEIQKRAIEDNHRWADNEELARIASSKPIGRFSLITLFVHLWQRRPHLTGKSRPTQTEQPDALITPLRHR